MLSVILFIYVTGEKLNFGLVLSSPEKKKNDDEKCKISSSSFSRYEEANLKVGRKKTNLMFVGDGKGKTVISCGKSVFDNMTTFHTACFGGDSLPCPALPCPPPL